MDTIQTNILFNRGMWHMAPSYIFTLGFTTSSILMGALFKWVIVKWAEVTSIKTNGGKCRTAVRVKLKETKPQATFSLNQKCGTTLAFTSWREPTNLKKTIWFTKFKLPLVFIEYKESHIAAVSGLSCQHQERTTDMRHRQRVVHTHTHTHTAVIYPAGPF